MRPLNIIAHDIMRTWHRPYFGAVPYLQAMLSLDNINEDYGHDSARSIVLYFLSNATTWRGPDARRLKAERDACRDPDVVGDAIRNGDVPTRIERLTTED
jgi:hypothetical protein